MRKGISATLKNNQSSIRASEVISLLQKEYGPFVWKPRLDAVSELVYTVLSQHTSDINSERAFHKLLQTFGSLEAVATADVEQITSSISSGGLSRIKAPRIKKILNYIKKERGSLDIDFLKDFPLCKAKEWLKKLPGIGPKSAAVILCFSLGMPAMPVDTHIYRVSKRLGFIRLKTSVNDAHDILEKMVAPKKVFPFHLLLINHGRKICKAQKPQCNKCVLAHGCPSKRI
jgi:endonuclease-3